MSKYGIPKLCFLCLSFLALLACRGVRVTALDGVIWPYVAWMGLSGGLAGSFIGPWGSPEWGLGAIYLCLGAYYLSGCVRGPQGHPGAPGGVGRAVVWSSVALSLMALIQELCWTYGWGGGFLGGSGCGATPWSGSFGGRAYWGVGNPAFLGGYLAVCLAAGVGRWWPLVLTVVALTGSRGALAVGILAVAWRWDRRWALGLAVAGALVVGGSRATAVKSDRGRVAVWAVSVAAVASRPVLGWGAGNTLDAIESNRGPGYDREYGGGSTQGHAHNWVLEAGVAGGIPGMVLVVVLAWRAWLAAPGARGPLLAAGALGLVNPLALEVKVLLAAMVGAEVGAGAPAPRLRAGLLVLLACVGVSLAEAVARERVLIRCVYGDGAVVEDSSPREWWRTLATEQMVGLGVMRMESEEVSDGR